MNLPKKSPDLMSLQSEIESAALRFFLENTHPVTGQVLDRVLNFTRQQGTGEDNRTSSIAATGFGMAVIANAAKRGLMDKHDAEKYCLRAIEFARDRVPHFKGWMVHFVDWATGEHLDGAEFSTIDTALFLGGALYAGQIFPSCAEPARELYRAIDFGVMLTDDGQKIDKTTISMSYDHNGGFCKTQWGMYGEQMLLLLIGLGHPTAPLPAQAWLAWQRENLNPLVPHGMMGLGEALFVHQYSHLFIDFRGFRDSFNVDYFTNSVKVSEYHREIMRQSTAIETLKAGYWGFSAGEAPGGAYNVYNAIDRMSTVCLGAALGSVMFKPEILADAHAWKNGPHQAQIWGRYGFIDSLDVDRNWFGERVFGITKGPEFLSLANLKTETSVWFDFMQIPEIQVAMKTASEASPVSMLPREA